MPARCESCGEEALTETARFCIGCGAALPEVDPREVLAELAQSAQPEPPPPPPTPTPRVDTPAFSPRPVPSSSAASSPPPPRPQRPPPAPPLRDLSPEVPLSLVVAGVIALLALLLILLLAA